MAVKKPTAKTTQPKKALGQGGTPARRKAAPASKPAASVQKRGIVNAKRAEASTNLSELEARFAQEYGRDLNGTQAYLRCKPDATNGTARVAATRLIAKPNVQAEISRLKAIAAQEAGIDAATVVRTAWQMMTADARELSEVFLSACRHCWGLNHRYQHTDGELADAKAAHKRALALAGTAAQRKKLGEFDAGGGGGYSVHREPNDDCPSCGGAGIPRTVIKDTRRLSPGAAQLYAGVKETKEGLEVKAHSKDAALDKMFRHFGLYKDKIELTMPTAIFRDMTGRKD